MKATKDKLEGIEQKWKQSLHQQEQTEAVWKEKLERSARDMEEKHQNELQQLVSDTQRTIALSEAQWKAALVQIEELVSSEKKAVSARHMVQATSMALEKTIKDRDATITSLLQQMETSKITHVQEEDRLRSRIETLLFDFQTAVDMYKGRVQRVQTTLDSELAGKQQLLQKIKTIEDKRPQSSVPVCAFCEELPVQIILFPCNHACVCGSCWSKYETQHHKDLLNCPICRSAIANHCHVFF